MKSIPLILLILSVFVSCSNLTPEQQAAWNATGNVVAQRTADLALDEAAARLRASRPVSPDRFVHDNK